MKKGYKKFTANSEKFNALQMLRNIIRDSFEVANVKWGGHWNGMNWENFSFFCTPETLKEIKLFCKGNGLEIEFNR